MKRTLITLICLLSVYLPSSYAGLDQNEIDRKLDEARKALKSEQFEIADSLAKEARNLAQTKGYRPMEAQCEHLLGDIAFYQEDFFGANDYYMQAHRLWEEVGKQMTKKDSLVLGRLYRDLAVIKARITDHKSQLIFAERGLKFFTALEDTSWMTHLAVDMANACKNYDEKALEAEQCFRKALSWLSSSENKRLEAAANYGLGLLFYDFDFENYPLDTARAYIEKALKIYQTIEEPEREAQCYNVCGALDRELGNMQLARRNFVKSETMAEAGGFTPQQFDALLNLALLDIKEDRFNEAVKNYEKAELIWEENEYSDVLDMVFMNQVGVALGTLRQKNINKLTIIVGILIITILFTTAGIYIGQQQQRQEKERGQHEKEVIGLLHSIDGATAEAREKGVKEERERLKKNVHNDIGSQLAATRWRIDTLLNSPTGQNGLKDELQTIWDMVDKAFQDSRNIERSLDRPSAFWYKDVEIEFASLQNIYRDSKPQVRFVPNDFDEHLFTPQEGKAIKQVLRIATANALIYSKADNYICQLNQLEDELIIAIEDDGIGFDPKKITSGSGLANLRELVENELNGQVQIDSKLGQGTTISIIIPLDH